MLPHAAILDLTIMLWFISLVAGFFGSLTGLGGGVLVIPFLALVLGVDIHYAAGAALVSVIATSSGAASAYVKEGFTNVRLGMFLEIATACGALIGASVAAYLPTATLAVIFGVILVFSSYLSGRSRGQQCIADHPDPLATRLRMNSAYPTPEGLRSYHAHRVPLGFGLMFIAGSLSGLLGIGAGAFKVLAMDQAMRLPFKVSTTTSNFMIGVTAAVGAGVYLNNGYIDPGLSMPVVLGVLPGSLLGARVLVAARSRGLRIVFAVVILLLGIEMIYNGFTGRFH
jgi:uncharacterized membrane protein YfcA